MVGEESGGECSIHGHTPKPVNTESIPHQRDGAKTLSRRIGSREE